MPYNVMVVDDDKDMAASLAEMIELLGHNAIIALGPRKAMASLSQAIPEIIFLDINMPGVDGLEVLRYLRRDPSTEGVQVVVVSANDSKADIDAAYRAGANAYIVKPATLDDVESAIRRVMGR